MLSANLVLGNIAICGAAKVGDELLVLIKMREDTK